MNKIPLIIFFVAIAITIPTMIIYFPPDNADGEEQIDPEPTNCAMGMSSANKVLCDKLDEILKNQEVIIDHLEDIYDMNS